MLILGRAGFVEGGAGQGFMTFSSSHARELPKRSASTPSPFSSSPAKQVHFASEYRDVFDVAFGQEGQAKKDAAGAGMAPPAPQ